MAEILVPEKTKKVLALKKPENHLEASVRVVQPPDRCVYVMLASAYSKSKGPFRSAPRLLFPPGPSGRVLLFQVEAPKKKRQAAAPASACSGPGSSDTGDFAPPKRQRNSSRPAPKATAKAPKAPKAAPAAASKPPAAPAQERRASGDERPEELQLRNDMGIKLGETRRVHMPMPREVLLRHHADCKCWKCKAGIARGKVGALLTPLSTLPPTL